MQQFPKNVRKYTTSEELTEEMLNDLVDKIVVHVPDKNSGKCTRKIEAYYRVAGVIDIAEEENVLPKTAAGRMAQTNSLKTQSGGTDT